MPEREPVTVELAVEVAAMPREQAAAGHMSEELKAVRGERGPRAA